jgi:hypothetical protein
MSEILKEKGQNLGKINKALLKSMKKLDFSAMNYNKK